MADHEGVRLLAAAAQSAEPRFQNGECGIFIGSSATRADIKANSKFDVGYGMMPYWPDVAGAPQNTIIGGATLVGAARPAARGIQGRGEILLVPVEARGAGRLAPEHGLSADHPRRLRADARAGFLRPQSRRRISIEQITLKPPTENSKGLRLGSFVLIRDVIDDELEQAFCGKKSAQAAMDSAVERGNRLLRQFERASPDR